MEKEKDNNLFLNKIFYIIVGIIILLGIYIRTWTYLKNIPFTSDEALLGTIFFKTPVLKFFNEIDTIVKIPPLWGILEKIITNIFGPSFFTYRLIPYLTSILSVIAFFFLLKNIFKSKVAIIIGLILFIINVPLVFFTVNFRPYESDVFICILLLLSYKYVSFKEITPPPIAFCTL